MDACKFRYHSNESEEQYWIKVSFTNEKVLLKHYGNVMIGTMASQITLFLLNSLVMRRSKKTSKLRITGLCAGNSPVTDEFPAQMASNAENVSIWWRHHETNSSKYKAAFNINVFRDSRDQ